MLERSDRDMCPVNKRSSVVYDCVGVVLDQRVCHANQSEMRQRERLYVDGDYNGLSMDVERTWVRVIFTMNSCNRHWIREAAEGIITCGAAFQRYRSHWRNRAPGLSTGTHQS